MPAPGPNIRQGFVTADTALVTTAETIAATVAGISTDGASQRIDIRASVSILTGASVTGVTVQIRRGTTTAGALVGEAVTEGVGAAANISVPIEVQDSPGDVAGQAYVVTVTQIGATGNGNIINADLVAEVITS